MKKNLNKKIVTAIALTVTLALPTTLMAKVSGQCGDCHTMHNSQDNSAMTGTAFGLSDGTDFTAGNSSLLRYGCVGCHTGINDGGEVPFVTAAADPTTNTLAGGNFFWVGADDSKGHNVAGIKVGQDSNMPNFDPPGYTGALTWNLANQLTCAGTMGCHGNTADGGAADEFGSIAGGHHGDGGDTSDGTTPTARADATKTYTFGSTTDMSAAYRMLSGIKGIEDSSWEHGVTAGADDGTTNHNQYYGVDRATDATAADGTISTLCANCHGDFHATASSTGNMSSPWVRHPTDFDMGDATGSEYVFYNGNADDTIAPYSVIAPVASDTIAGEGDVLANINPKTADGTAIVTCISCHRAHGSPNPDLLRWDYTTGVNMEAHTGLGNVGCFICHTTKDDV